MIRTGRRLLHRARMTVLADCHDILRRSGGHGLLVHAAGYRSGDNGRRVGRDRHAGPGDIGRVCRGTGGRRVPRPGLAISFIPTAEGGDLP